MESNMKYKVPVNADCDDLNRRYGAPERIVFRPSKHGHPIVVLANQYGTCEVALWGGQVFSYRPTGNQPVLFMPCAYDDVPQGNEVHGGIPICWPWFGSCGEPGSRSHGFARYQPWYVVGSQYSEDLTEVTIGLTSNDETRKLWPHEFELELKIQLSMKLTLTLTSKNTGETSFWVTEGFHPYLRVKDSARVTVRGIDGCEFYDTEEPEKGDKRVFVGDCKIERGSKVFRVGKPEYALIDPDLRRAIAMVSRGTKKLIVWNPGEGTSFRGLADDDYKRFACVEPSTLFRPDGYEMKPGDTHEMLMAVQSVPEVQN
jgi:D-hexose-6-phosphate mutarotase